MYLDTRGESGAIDMDVSGQAAALNRYVLRMEERRRTDEEFRTPTKRSRVFLTRGTPLAGQESRRGSESPDRRRSVSGMMKKIGIVVVAVLGVAGAYALGYFRGHRAASILCLKEAAGDLWLAPYWATTVPTNIRASGSVPVMQLHSAIQSLSEAKAILENPWRTHHQRRGSYEKVVPDTREQQIADLGRKIEEWEKLKQELQKRSTEPEGGGYSPPAARSAQPTP
jgi:hypothetical protein